MISQQLESEEILEGQVTQLFPGRLKRGRINQCKIKYSRIKESWKHLKDIKGVSGFRHLMWAHYNTWIISFWHELPGG
jgi:hypothetical protein